MSSRCAARTVRWAGGVQGAVRDLADPVHVLLAEPQPEPGVHQGCVVRGHDRVLHLQAALHPGRRRGGVQVADRLRLRGGVSGRLDPDVGPPRRVGPAPAQQVAGHVAGLGGHGTGRSAVEKGLHLGGRGGRILEAGGQQRLRRPVGGVAAGEQPARRGDVPRLEGADLWSGHGRRRYGHGSPPRDPIPRRGRPPPDRKADPLWCGGGPAWKGPRGRLRARTPIHRRPRRSRPWARW